MLVPKTVIDNIDDIVERSYLGFTHMLLGDSVLSPEDKIKAESMGLIIGQKPLIELLYILVRQRSTPQYQTDATLQSLINSIINMGILPAVTDTEVATIEQAKEAMYANIVDTKNQVKKDIKKEIRRVNSETRNAMVVNPSKVNEDRSINKLTLAVGAAILASQTSFVKGFISELTNYVNNTIVDEVKSRSGSTQGSLLGQAIESTPVGNAIVYKITTNDSKLCNWCDGFYNTPDGPRMFKLSELQRNGTNIGKPRSAWMPVLGATHHNCRCTLAYKETK